METSTQWESQDEFNGALKVKMNFNGALFKDDGMSTGVGVILRDDVGMV